MNKLLIFFLIFTVLIAGLTYAKFANADKFIPPTAAFQKINMTGGNVTAFSYNDFVTFVAGSGVLITPDYLLHTITFNASGSTTISSIHDIGNVTSSGCGINEILQVNASAIWACATAGSGEVNTASNVGTGIGPFKAKSGVDLQFFSFVNDTNISITQLTNEIYFALNTIPKSKISSSGQFGWNEVSKTGSSIHNLGNVTENGCAEGQTLTVNSTGFWVCSTSVTSDNTTATNIGIGVGIYDSEVADQLRFKTLVNDTNISIVSLTNETSITLNTIPKSKISSSGQFGWNEVSKTGSSIHNIGNVTENGCGLNQVLAVNSTAYWVCYSLPVSSGFTNIASMPQTTATLIADNSTVSNSAVFKTLTQGTGISITNGSQTVTIASSITQGFTNITPAYTSADSSLLVSNSSNSAVFKNLKAGSGITLTNNTQDITIATSGGSGFTNITPVSTSADSSLLVANSSNSAVFKNLKAGTGISLTNNTQDITITNTVTDTTKVSSSPQTTATIITDNSTSGVTLKTLTQGTGISITNGSQAVTIASSITQGFTNVASAPQTTATLIADNTTSPTSVIFKTLTQGSGITLTNNTNSITIATSGGSGFTNITPVSTSSDSSLLVSNSSNSAVFKNLKAGSGITLTNNTQDITIATSGGSTTVLAANVTNSNNQTETNVWDIALTASQGNSISGVINALTNRTGQAVVVAINASASGSVGTCNIGTPTTSTAIETDILNVTNVGRSPNTGTSNWFAGLEKPEPINFDCSVFTSATPGNLRVWIIGENVASSTPGVKALKGSYYIKTP